MLFLVQIWYLGLLVSNLLWLVVVLNGLAATTAEIAWIQSIIHELCIPQDIPFIWCNKQSAAHLAANTVFHCHSKHIELDLHPIRL